MTQAEKYMKLSLKKDNNPTHFKSRLKNLKRPTTSHRSGPNLN